MPGLFQGLEIGKRALLSHQITLQTIGHNIANVDTPGYTRQRVNIQASNPEHLTYGSIGTGIKVSDIRHIRDQFLTEQYREANKSLGQWTYKERTLAQIESVLNEPNDDSFNDIINQFWDAWTDLSTNSDSSSHREVILSKAKQVVNTFHQLSEQLTSLRDSVNRDLASMTNEVNRITSEIAKINQQIKSAELGGTKANDLRDARDKLTDELANYIDVNTLEKENGATIVYMGAMALVDGSDALPISVVDERKGNASINKLVWAGTDIELKNLNGQMKGLMESRDEIIPDYLNDLDQMAKTLVEEVNALHTTGYGFQKLSNGVNFFNPDFTTAATISVNLELEHDVNKIAASQSVDGDNLLALELAALRDKTVMEDNSRSIGDYYRLVVGEVGISTKEAISFTNNFQTLRHHTENSRQSVQGVSLDEEMANMIKFQHAYDAAARVITTMDQALDTVISGMGIVGR